MAFAPESFFSGRVQSSKFDHLEISLGFTYPHWIDCLERLLVQNIWQLNYSLHENNCNSSSNGFPVSQTNKGQTQPSIFQVHNCWAKVRFGCDWSGHPGSFWKRQRKRVEHFGSFRWSTSSSLMVNMVKSVLAGWWFQMFFVFTLIFGMVQFDKHIF